jgi:hypothetical protein
MSKTGVSTLDGIGAAFPEILRAVEHTSKIGVQIDYSLLSSLEIDKSCLYFIHDLVLLAGPITHAEIAELLKFLFGEKDFDTLKSLLGVLRESKLVSTRQLANKSWIYSATTTDFFLRYQGDISALMASFRAHHLKANAERFTHG